MVGCPTNQQLHDFATKRLGGPDLDSIHGHVATCPLCRVRLSSLSGSGSEGPTLVTGSGTDPEQSFSLYSPESVDAIPVELRDHPRYRVECLLGVGGMGAVYKAEHRLLERPVVLKVIRPDLGGRSERVDRFLREARVSARLHHSNVVTLYEAERAGDSLFLVMEYLDGLDLARVLDRDGTLPVDRVCADLCQAAMGLQHIHDSGLVHRDIKPSNLFRTKSGVVKVLDLGLAILREDSSAGLTTAGKMLGTVNYTAPEQWEDSRTIDHRADIYSLGCTLYHLLTGTVPYGGPRHSTVLKQMWAHAQAPIPEIREVRPDVPAVLSEIVQHMMAKMPGNRPARAADIAKSLAPFAAGGHHAPAPVLPDVAKPHVEPTPAAPTPPRSWRRREILLGAGATGLIGLAGIGLAAFRSRSSKLVPAIDASLPPIRVGVLHSLTGTMAISERPVVDATLLAIEEINRDGGLLRRRVEAVVEDGRSDWPTFAARAEALITRERVCAVFGCWTSASRKTVKPVFEKHNHLLVYPVQYEGLEQSPNIVYTGAAPNQQIIPAVKWCCGFLRKRRLFLVGSDYVFPRAANAIIRDYAAELGAEIVGESYVPLGATNLDAAVAEIRSSKADLILNTINGDSNVAFFRSLRAVGIAPADVPTMSFSISEEELGNLGLGNVVGDYAAWNYFQSIERPRNTAFVQAFRTRYGAGRVVSDPMEAAYFGVYLWSQAVRDAGTDAVASVRSAIKGQQFDAPEGEVAIDPATQHTKKSIRIGRVDESGRFAVVFCSDTPIDPVPFPPSRSRSQWESFLTDLQLGWGGQWARPTRQ